MPKTGWKYTKQTPAKGKSHMLPRSNASSKLGRTVPQGKRGDSNMRSSETIKRLKMYNNGKAIRNKEGTIVGGQYMMKNRAGDSEITNATGRIAPDRRWFGNTRVVGQTELDKFREEMTSKVSDPYSVVIKRKKLPMGLLQDAPSVLGEGGGSLGKTLLTNESFEHTYGKKSQRKKMKLEQLFSARTSKYDDNPKPDQKDSNPKQIPGGRTTNVVQQPDSDEAAYMSLLSTAKKSAETYEKVNDREGIVPWGKDSSVVLTEGEGIDWRAKKKDDLFLKGQSKRIWGEFYKVVDCSDIILHVIDARNVPGTRCDVIEKHVTKNASHKHLVFVLNKIDLVPNWVAKRWIGELSAVRPTIAFHASPTHAFGKGALISLLRQFGKLHSDKKQISVGVLGYPNVGKSSVINTLISKKSCKVAPIPGETKIWQYVTLFRNIYLIDSPGVVVNSSGDTEIDSVLKGVVRAERLENPEDFVDPITAVVRREHIAAHYGLPKDGEETWKNSVNLMEMISKNAGRLLKGGEPCLRSAAIYIINDFQRGRLPHFVAPPELKNDKEVKTSPVKLDGVDVKQNLDKIGEIKDVPEKESTGDGDGLHLKQVSEEEGVSSDEGSDDDSPSGPLILSGNWDDQ